MRPLIPGFDGLENRLIRYYKYCTAGVDLIAQFKNLFLMIFGAYFLLKLDNPWLLVIAFIISLITSAILGWYRMMRMDKAIEWLTMKFSTHYGIKNFDYQENNNILLREIKFILKEMLYNDNKKS